jgi:hypothetical protein
MLTLACTNSGIRVFLVAKENGILNLSDYGIRRTGDAIPFDDNNFALHFNVQCTYPAQNRSL